jgi:hypothetical protein
VYCISRDGQVLRDVAERLAARLRLDLRFGYLYGSRQAWLLPTLTDPSPENLRWFVQRIDVDDLTPRVLLGRFGLAAGDVADRMGRLGLAGDAWDRALSGSERLALVDAVVHDPVLRERIVRQAAEQQALMLGYLDQEGVRGDRPVALVDISTGGTLHHALTTVLRGAGAPAPTSFILHLRRESPVDPAARIETWLAPEPGRRIADIVLALELFTIADHETVLGYERVGASVRPVLRAGEGDVARRWGQPAVRRAIARTVEELLVEPSDLDVDLRPAVLPVLKEFVQRPTAAEARAWSAAPLEDGWGSHSYAVQVAAPLRWRSTARTWFRGGRLRTHRHAWSEASLRMTSPVLRAVVMRSQRTRRRRAHPDPAREAERPR